MPTIKGDKFLTYRDLMSGLKGDKTFDHDIVELMLQNNPILEHMIIKEANDGTSNKTTIRTGLPTATWSAFYEGVQASKGSKQQIRNTAGFLKSKLEIDCDLYDQAPDKSALLYDEVSSHSEAMMNEMANALIYGNIKDDPRKFNGFMTFLSNYGNYIDGSGNYVSATDDDVPSYYVINGAKYSSPSGSARRSILLVGWGNKAVSCFYPRGSKGGLQKGEFKKVDVEDKTKGGTYEAYIQYFKWQLGLDIRDFRYIGRIANIELDHMLDTSGQPDYIELLRHLRARVRADGVRQCMYMDRLTLEAIETLLARKTQGNAMTFSQLQEHTVPTLYGIPVFVTDAMKTNEAAVSAVA